MVVPDFTFLVPGPLIDDDLELVLVEKIPGDPLINYVPAYKFKMTLTPGIHVLFGLDREDVSSSEG